MSLLRSLLFVDPVIGYQTVVPLGLSPSSQSTNQITIGRTVDLTTRTTLSLPSNNRQTEDGRLELVSGPVQVNSKVINHSPTALPPNPKNQVPNPTSPTTLFLPCLHLISTPSRTSLSISKLPKLDPPKFQAPNPKFQKARAAVDS